VGGDVLPAVIDRVARELPITAADIAADLSTSRRTLTRVVRRDTGQEWSDWISPISRPSQVANVDDPGMKRVTLTLSDHAFTALRRQALDELRDPRVVARRIIERDLAERTSAQRTQPSPVLARDVN
jgi:hypothetical protein